MQQVDLIDHMGTDLSVVNAARVSFAKEHQEFDEISDTKLINYLANHSHWTPFSHTAITLRVKAPVPIRTQCFKHKIGLSENEESRRYITIEPEIYIPEFRTKPKGNIKQDSGDIHPDNDYWQGYYKTMCGTAIDTYNKLLEAGIAPEQARFILPQGTMVNWIWTGNLYSFANFYLKRSDSHAQKEIQDIANQVASIIEPLFPVSWNALTNRSKD